MHLFPALRARYTREPFSAPEAQRRAELIAWSPVVFEVSRLMVKFGILSLLRDSDAGLTVEEIAEATSLSPYAVTVLTDASLSIGTILVDEDTDRFSLSKTGWFLLTDEGTRVNLDFNHAVNYRGMFHLEEALREGRPAGLATLGDWPTIYEGLSQLPDDVRESWFAFDHYYSDHSFDAALDLVFSRPIHHLMDVGGNTGRFALRCVERDADVCVTIVDLPGQIGLMRRNVAGQLGAERIEARRSPRSALSAPHFPPVGRDLDEPVPRLFLRSRDSHLAHPGGRRHGLRNLAVHHGNLLGSPALRDGLPVFDPHQRLFYRNGQRQQQNVSLRTPVCPHCARRIGGGCRARRTRPRTHPARSATPPVNRRASRRFDLYIHLISFI